MRIVRSGASVLIGRLHGLANQSKARLGCGVYPIIRDLIQACRHCCSAMTCTMHSCYACCMREAVIFDTEFTAWPGSAQRNWTAPGEFREIIQIGAIKVNCQTMTEVEAFSVLVKPTLNPMLSEYITGLTGITQADIDVRGMNLTDAVRAFLAFCGGLPMFCYGYDGWIIAKNLALLGHSGFWTGVRPSNIGEWFQSAGVDVASINSSGLAAAVGASYDGRAHEAVGDCRSILAAVRALIGRGVDSPFKD